MLAVLNLCLYDGVVMIVIIIMMTAVMIMNGLAKRGEERGKGVNESQCAGGIVCRKDDGAHMWPLQEEKGLQTGNNRERRTINKMQYLLFSHVLLFILSENNNTEVK